jgi:glycosyltransferase involved in cell wall biosynthesis
VESRESIKKSFERPINVEFDSQIFQMQARGGISRYFTQLIKTFREHPELGVNPKLKVRFTINEHLAEAFPEWNLTLIRNPFASLVLRGYASIFGMTPSKDTQIVHETFYGLGLRLPRSDKVPRITTLHDMIPELLHESKFFFSPHLFKSFRLRKAEGVIAISQSTVHQYRASNKEPRDDLRVIALGASQSPVLSEIETIPLPKEYFLYVGKRSEHKNAVTLLKALSQTPNLECAVLFVGGGDFSNEERRFVDQLGLNSRVSQAHPMDAQMPVIYGNALATVIPSTIEGFGLPLIEAGLAGCPVLASSIPVFKEVMGEAAVYFDPNDSKELADLLQAVIDERLPLDELRASARSRALQFTWKECAEKTAAFYHEVLSTNDPSKTG